MLRQTPGHWQPGTDKAESSSVFSVQHKCVSKYLWNRYFPQARLLLNLQVLHNEWGLVSKISWHNFIFSPSFSCCLHSKFPSVSNQALSCNPIYIYIYVILLTGNNLPRGGNRDVITDCLNILLLFCLLLNLFFIIMTPSLHMSRLCANVWDSANDPLSNLCLPFLHLP